VLPVAMGKTTNGNSVDFIQPQQIRRLVFSISELFLRSRCDTFYALILRQSASAIPDSNLAALNGGAMSAPRRRHAIVSAQRSYR
jgi:hypothetical protein